MLSLAIIGLIALESCQKDELEKTETIKSSLTNNNNSPCSDTIPPISTSFFVNTDTLDSIIRTHFVGTYTVSDYCNKCSGLKNSYQIQIGEHPTKTNYLLIHNYYHSSDSMELKVEYIKQEKMTKLFTDVSVIGYPVNTDSIPTLSILLDCFVKDQTFDVSNLYVYLKHRVALPPDSLGNPFYNYTVCNQSWEKN